MTVDELSDTRAYDVSKENVQVSAVRVLAKVCIVVTPIFELVCEVRVVVMAHVTEIFF